MLDAAVVGKEQDQRVLGEAGGIHGGDNAADRCIEFGEETGVKRVAGVSGLW